jgi:hypothetical protein
MRRGDIVELLVLVLAFVLLLAFIAIVAGMILASNWGHLI